MPEEDTSAPDGRSNFNARDGQSRTRRPPSRLWSGSLREAAGVVGQASSDPKLSEADLSGPERLQLRLLTAPVGCPSAQGWILTGTHMRLTQLSRLSTPGGVWWFKTKMSEVPKSKSKSLADSSIAPVSKLLKI